MAYCGIMRIEKRGRSAVHGLQLEACRERDDHDINGRDFADSDIDWSKTDDNIRLIESESWNREITRQIHEAGLKERSNSIVMLDGLYTASPEFFEGKSVADMERYFRDCLDFHIREYCEGDESKMVSAVVHLDEATPHMQVASVPIYEDEKGAHLSAKTIMGNREDYRLRQDRFYDEVTKQYGLDRGEINDREDRKLHTTKREWQLATQENEIERNNIKLIDQDKTSKAIESEITEKVGDANRMIAELNAQMNEQVRQIEISKKELKELKATKELMEIDLQKLSKSVTNLEKKLFKAEDIDESATITAKIDRVNHVLEQRSRELDTISKGIKNIHAEKGLFSSDKVTLPEKEYKSLLKMANGYIGAKNAYNAEKSAHSKLYAQTYGKGDEIVRSAKRSATELLDDAKAEAWKIKTDALKFKGQREATKLVKAIQKMPGGASLVAQAVEQIARTGMELQQEEERER